MDELITRITIVLGLAVVSISLIICLAGPILIFIKGILGFLAVIAIVAVVITLIERTQDRRKIEK